MRTLFLALFITIIASYPVTATSFTCSEQLELARSLIQASSSFKELHLSATALPWEILKTRASGELLAEMERTESATMRMRTELVKAAQAYDSLATAFIKCAG